MAVVGLAIAVAVLAVAFWRTALVLLEQNGRLLARLDALEGAPSAHPALAAVGLPVGSAAPSFALDSVTDGPVTLAELTGGGRPVLLVFSDPGCGPCAALMPSVAHWQREHAPALATVVIATGTRDANAAKAHEAGLGTVLLDTGGTVAGSFLVPGTPSAVLIGSDGRISSAIAVGAPNVESLAATVISTVHAPEPALSLVGKPAPAFTLTAADGIVMTEEHFRRHAGTVVLFWNSGCGFCQRMRARLQQWDLAASGGGRSLLVRSTDAAETADPLRLNAPVLRDDGSVMRAFGATGTPIAVLVDSEGVIASELAPGEQTVFDLLGPASDSGRKRLPVVPGGSS